MIGYQIALSFSCSLPSCTPCCSLEDCFSQHLEEDYWIDTILMGPVLQRAHSGHGRPAMENGWWGQGEGGGHKHGFLKMYLNLFHIVLNPPPPLPPSPPWYRGKSQISGSVISSLITAKKAQCIAAWTCLWGWGGVGWGGGGGVDCRCGATVVVYFQQIWVEACGQLQSHDSLVSCPCAEKSWSGRYFRKFTVFTTILWGI